MYRLYKDYRLKGKINFRKAGPLKIQWRGVL